MKIDGKLYRTIWFEGDKLVTIDQRELPFELKFFNIDSVERGIFAIKDMVVRGAPLIGVAGAGTVYILLKEIKDGTIKSSQFDEMIESIRSSRPTAINLNWAVDRVLKEIEDKPLDIQIGIAKRVTEEIALEDIEMCRSIGKHGLEIIREIYKKKGSTVNILTHCNAGWLATVDFGTATSPIYHAAIEGIPVHVWVDETRPRNQGGRLTAFELLKEGIDSTLITDNGGGILMQHGKVDLVIVGSDRTSLNGDVANKIGTYLKALAAKDNNIPFYVALPTSTFDISIEDGVKDIPIENRSETEITHIDGVDMDGNRVISRIVHQDVKAENPGFDVTPARLVTALITDKGVIEPKKDEILRVVNNG